MNYESVLENEKHKILWDFEIQTDHLILARRPDLVIVNKKKKKRTIQIFYQSFVYTQLNDQRQVPADHRIKLKEKRRGRIDKQSMPGRLEAKRPPALAKSPLGRRAAALTSLSSLYSTGHLC